MVKFLLSSFLVVCMSLSVMGQGPEVDCSEELFLMVPHPDPTRCADFIVCMRGERIDFQCDINNIFNPRLNRCVPGDQRTCGDLAVPEDACIDEFFSIHPHPSNCGRFFICMRNEPLVFTCEDDSIFSLFHERCMRGNRDTCEIEEEGPYKVFLE